MKKGEKVRENRLRRMAKRQGLQLEKSRTRDPMALDYGKYRLTSDPVEAYPIHTMVGDRLILSARIPQVVFGGRHLLDGRPNATLDEIEEYLTSDRGKEAGS